MDADQERNNASAKREQEENTFREMLNRFTGKTASASELIKQAEEEQPTKEEASDYIKTSPKQIKFKRTSRISKLAGNIKAGSGRYYKTNLKGKGKQEFSRIQKGLQKRYLTASNGRNYVVLANGQHRFISKQQYKTLRSQKRIPKAKAVYNDSGIDVNDNIFEQEHRFREGQFNQMERSRWRNTEHYSMPLRRVQQRLADLDKQHSFQNDASVNLLQAHRRMVSGKNNTIFNTARTKNLLDTSENNLMKRNENSIDINKLNSPEILQAPNIFSNQNPASNENILNNPNNKLNWGMIDLRRQQNNNSNNKRKEVPTKISFW